MARDSNILRDLLLGLFLVVVATAMTASGWGYPPLLWALAFVLLVVLARPYLKRISSRMDPVAAYFVFIGGFALIGAGFGYWVLISQADRDFQVEFTHGNGWFVQISSDDPEHANRFALVLWDGKLMTETDTTFRDVELIYETADDRYQTRAANWQTGVMDNGKGPDQAILISGTNLNIPMQWRNVRDVLGRRIPSRSVVRADCLFVLEKAVKPEDIKRMQLKVSDYFRNVDLIPIDTPVEWKQLFDLGARLTDQPFRIGPPAQRIP